jgi:cyclophilin family peptidyl-prolyl cis-trans isomerase
MKKIMTFCALILLSTIGSIAQENKAKTTEPAKAEKKSDNTSQKGGKPATNSKPAKGKSAKGGKDVEHVVLIKTSMGDMKVKLYNATPQHRDNFLKLVNSHFYDSLLFHRVIPNFMIQGGDPLSKNAKDSVPLGMGDNGYTIPAEFVDSLYHQKGAIAAARTENPTKASSGCQFYIVQGQVLNQEQINQMEMQRGLKMSEKQKQIYTTVGGSPWLDGGYTVFGQVIEGLDVIDKIAATKTLPGDRPVKNVYILSMKQLK